VAPDRVHGHWESSREIVLRLAASLDTYEAPRRAFLASPAVARVLDSAIAGGGRFIPPGR
jgi:hypothetical protein